MFYVPQLKRKLKGGAQISDARSGKIIFVGLQYGTIFMSPYWHRILRWFLDFWKICAPPGIQYVHTA
jgi:hypothetical protein